MKRKLTKAEFEALTSADVKALYTQDGENYILKLSDDDDPDKLRRARDREKEDADKAKSDLKIVQDKLDAISNEDARKRGDIEALEASWKKKRDDDVADLNTKLVEKDKQIIKLLVTDVAKNLAVSLAGDSHDIIMPHLEKRLRVEYDANGEPITRVLDEAGKLSALTVADLEKEFVANKKFSAIIVASKASGGATGDRRTSSAVPNGKKFDELNEAERVAFHKSDPEGFKAASAEAHKQRQSQAASPQRRL